MWGIARRLPHTWSQRKYLRRTAIIIRKAFGYSSDLSSIFLATVNAKSCNLMCYLEEDRDLSGINSWIVARDNVSPVENPPTTVIGSFSRA